MSESEFTKAVVEWLKPYVSGYEIASKKSVLYTLSVDESGAIQLGVDAEKKPTRGGGTGFEQDILVFEELEPDSKCDTSIIPRVIAEVKFGGVTTHDTITYAEKARRIRTIYPFVRYGLILGQMETIPGRVLRLGQEFDFVIAIDHPTLEPEREIVGRLIKEELQVSQDLGDMLSGEKKVNVLSRSLRSHFAHFA